MAGPVYSTRFLCSNTASGTTSYTVPAGYLAVVRDVTACNNGPGATDFVFVTNRTLGVALFLERFTAVNQTLHQECRVVLEPGEVLETSNGSTGGIAVTVSGYLLTLP